MRKKKIEDKDFICTKGIQDAAKVLRAVNHPLRRDILYLLRDTKLTVGIIQDQFKIAQTICSSHLGVLRREGILKVENDGKFRYCSINESRLREINAHAQELARSDANTIIK